MALEYSIRVPQYGFIWQLPTDVNCLYDEQVCIPVFAAEDLAFQFLVDVNNAALWETDYGMKFEYFIKVSTSCTPGQYDYSAPIMYDLTWKFPTSTLGVGMSSVNTAFRFGDLPVNTCLYLSLVKRTWDSGTGQGDYHERIELCSKCFKVITDPCYTTLLQYRNNENAFGFIYAASPDIPEIDSFVNSVRMHFYLRNMQTPSEESGYNFPNGTFKKLMERINIQYDLETSNWNAYWHKCMRAALSHDVIHLTDTLSGVDSYIYRKDSYEINWITEVGVDHVTAKGRTKIILNEPLNLINSNCNG